MPVRVLKHCSRKFSDSRTSRPDDGSGLFGTAAPPAFAAACCRCWAFANFLLGSIRAVMAWTLSCVICK